MRDHVGPEDASSLFVRLGFWPFHDRPKSLMAVQIQECQVGEKSRANETKHECCNYQLSSISFPFPQSRRCSINTLQSLRFLTRSTGAYTAEHCIHTAFGKCNICPSSLKRSHFLVLVLSSTSLPLQFPLFLPPSLLARLPAPQLLSLSISYASFFLSVCAWLLP